MKEGHVEIIGFATEFDIVIRGPWSVIREGGALRAQIYI